ncbi:MAG TPA: hypothetical protein VFF04_05725 [Candidatus Babeliales bacterium]|nr:hypothetical protein [Candidatus Babeliales bacterium]
MSMLNSTLIVQGINFLIAYILLRKLLFRPAVSLVMQEQSHISSLESSIDSRKAAIAEQEQEKLRRWKAFQQLFKNKIPSYQKQFEVGKMALPPIQYHVLKQEQAQTLSKDVADALVAQVNHVRW